jgi:hypothetical protein
MSIITWWLEVGLLAFAGGIAIGLGVSWLFVPQDQNSKVDPSAPGAWPPILGALRATSKNEMAFSIDRVNEQDEKPVEVANAKQVLPKMFSTASCEGSRR